VSAFRICSISGSFFIRRTEVAFDDLRSTVSAEEMDKEENDRNDKEKVN
jgi:hypothetical protein